MRLVRVVLIELILIVYNAQMVNSISVEYVFSHVHLTFNWIPLQNHVIPVTLVVRIVQDQEIRIVLHVHLPISMIQIILVFNVIIVHIYILIQVNENVMNVYQDSLVTMDQNVFHVISAVLIVLLRIFVINVIE